MKNTILSLILILSFASCEPEPELTVINTDPPTITAKVELDAGPDTMINLPMRVNFEPRISIVSPAHLSIQTVWRQLTGPKIDVNASAFRFFEPGTYSFEISAQSSQKIMDIDTLNITAFLTKPCSTPQPIKLSKSLVSTFDFFAEFNTMAIVGDKILLGVGGDGTDINIYYNHNNFVSYDTKNAEWIIDQLDDPRAALSAVTIGNKLFLAGGNTTYPSSAVEIYDANNNSWDSIQTLSSARSRIAMAAAGSKIFFAGGVDKSGQEQRTIDIYDTLTKTWSSALLKEPKKDISAITIKNQVFFVGGSYKFTPLNTIEVYDLNTNSMSSFSMITARAKPIVNSFDNKLFIAGGVLDEAIFEYQTELYDIITHENTISCLSEYAFASAIVCSAWHQNRFYILNRQSPRGAIDVYNPATNTWSIYTDDIPENTKNFALYSQGNSLYLMQATSTWGSIKYSINKIE